MVKNIHAAKRYMRNYSANALTVLIILTLAGCKNHLASIDSAVAAENGGDHRQATQYFAEAAIGASPWFRLIEPQLGNVVPPEKWQREIEKYINWLTDGAAKNGEIIGKALNGLNRCAPQFESHNIARIANSAPFATQAAFIEQWNRAFNPPPTGETQRNAIIERATKENFSILYLTAPMNYKYDINAVSRKTARRITFTLFPESTVLLPLPPGEYIIIAKSIVEFQQGQYWNSEYTAIPLTIPSEPSQVTMNFRTNVPRRQP